MLITLALWPPRRRSNRTGSRTAPKPFLSDSQWLLIAELLADDTAREQAAAYAASIKDWADGSARASALLVERYG